MYPGPLPGGFQDTHPGSSNRLCISLRHEPTGHHGLVRAGTSSRWRTPSTPGRLLHHPLPKTGWLTQALRITPPHQLVISHPRTLTSSSPSSIIVGNGSTLLITSVGDSVLPGSFYLNNILLAPDLVQSLLSVRRFTTDNWCSMEFDPFGLSVKDLTTRNVIVRSNSTSPLYTMHLPSSFTSPSTVVAAAIVTPTT
jgi:hypothetical protein